VFSPQVTLRFGLFLPPFGPFAEPKAAVEVARRAELAGWDGVFLWDHLLPEGGAFAVADPWVMLGAMAAVTERVLLGTMVTPLARRRPWVIARQVATLNRLSSGRAVLGVGLGVRPDFEAFGEDADTKRRAEMVDEALEIIERLWSGEAFTFAGRHYRVDVPLSTPEEKRVPVWVANVGGRAGSLKRAARHDGIFPLAAGQRDISPEDLSDMAKRLEELGATVGNGFDIVLRGNASAAWPEQLQQPLKALAAAGMTWWLETLMHFDPLELSLRVVDAGPPKL
jgi:alkanesulfonate monooxygenase SsuD/methylene tetrahydromethanopterin reductase-like flavin-dependent oxidoreductase (luciferase family)